MRRSDRARLAIATIACSVTSWPLVAWVFAQSQEVINAQIDGRFNTMNLRLDRIETILNIILGALVLNFVDRVLQIRKAPGRREHGRD